MHTFDELVQPLRDLYIHMNAEVCLLERDKASLENSLAGALLQASSLREERDALQLVVEDLREQLAVPKRLEATQPQPPMHRESGGGDTWQTIAPRPMRD
jgi:hypothetical protein